MKSLQERMNDMKPYFRAIEVYNEALLVRVVFPSNWKVYNSTDEVIKVTPSETNSNEVIYYADSNNATYEDMFDLVEETIKANQEIVLKLKLLKDKVEELKELFSTHSFEELKMLRFDLEGVEKPKPKRKYNKKKKEAEKPHEEVIEENNKEGLENISDNNG